MQVASVYRVEYRSGGDSGLDDRAVICGPGIDEFPCDVPNPHAVKIALNIAYAAGRQAAKRDSIKQEK
jgi:hypothetical protein